MTLDYRRKLVLYIWRVIAKELNIQRADMIRFVSTFLYYCCDIYTQLDIMICIDSKISIFNHLIYYKSSKKYLNTENY